ncbi:MAG: hypothetical protein CML56_02500 [Rhodobacteraceae bacterium]|nr:hypothetical protein [Paracoccaceae bacterium]
MEYYFGILQTLGFHVLLGYSAYILLLTGQLSLAQVGFFAIGAYASGILTVLFEWHIFPALFIGATAAGCMAFMVGFPALRIKGLMLVIATIAFSEIVRLIFFNLRWRFEINGLEVGPDGAQGFREIRYFAANGWEIYEIVWLIWTMVAVATILLWWLDQIKAGAILRAIGSDELAAESSGINVTSVKIVAMACGGVIAGLSGGLYAHSTTYVDHNTFTVLLATFAVSYPLVGGLKSVFGTLAAVIFIQGILIEGLRFLGDYRTILFGALIILVMNFKPKGIVDENFVKGISEYLRLNKKLIK